ncbi:MAG: TrkA C-terminal domain-containing protein [Candidatus Dormibacteraeota bacterium]|nr:TrkA C-terminal domain-containing protein [Candidatus Dormibacteraeota bacterium]
MPWPTSSLLIAIRRDDALIVPNGDTELRAGDRMTVLLLAGATLSVADLITDASSPGGS